MRTTSSLSIIFAILLVSCKTLPSTPSAFSSTSPLIPIVHQTSGFSFPVRIAGFQRGNTMQYDRSGEDVSVGYNSSAAGVAADVYVYPARGRTLEMEFAARQAEVARVHPKAQLVAASKTKITPKQVVALFAIYSFDEVMGGSNQQLGSELVVAQSGERFIEYRFTYPVAAQPSAIKAIGDFEREFAWPQ